MCMIEINDNVSVNRKFMRITTPIVAVYFAELVEILKQVRRKNTYDVTTGYWKVNRKYIFDETGIETAEQKNCDQILVKLGIVDIDPGNSDQIRIDVKKYFELLAGDTMADEQVLPKSVKMTVADKRAARREGILLNLVKCFGDDLDDAATESVKRLVETYYDRGICTKAAWTPRADLVKAIAKDSDAVKELADYMVATGWASFPDMIESFMKKRGATRLGTEQKKNTGLMEGVEF